MRQGTTKMYDHDVHGSVALDTTPWTQQASKSASEVPVLLLHNLDRAWSEAELQEVLMAVKKLEAALGEAGHPVTSLAIHRDVETVLRDFAPSQYIVFNWCDGLEGDPKAEHLVPQALEALGFTYTGAEAKTLFVSQDKRQIKRALQTRGIPTPQGRAFCRPEAEGWDRFPAIVKPASEHCSFGITREAVVDSQQEMEHRIACVLETFREPALVEDFIDGREFHVAVWGNGRPHVLPLAEMDFSAFDDIHDRLCTFESSGTRSRSPIV